MKVSLHKQEDVLHPYDDEALAFMQGIPENDVVIADIKHCSPKDFRSLQQNRMQFKWFRDMEQQGDQTALEYRAYHKLHHGVPLLRAEDEEFRAIYDKVIRPLDYADKLALMIEPIDLPVTSRMSVELMAKYLKAISDDALGKGFRLTTFEHLFEWLEDDSKKQRT